MLDDTHTFLTDAAEGWEDPGYISLHNFATAIRHGVIASARIASHRPATGSNPQAAATAEANFNKLILQYAQVYALYRAETGDVVIQANAVLEVKPNIQGYIAEIAEDELFLRTEIRALNLSQYKQLSNLSEDRQIALVSDYLNKHFWPAIRGTRILLKSGIDPNGM